jgi:hypothetical protein
VINEELTCDSCGFEFEDDTYLSEYEVRVGPKKRKFCFICSKTFISNSTVYPEQYRGQTETLQAIGFVGNLLLMSLNKNRQLIKEQKK